MKITGLKQQVKNPNRVSVFVDDKYSFSFSLDEVVKHKIKNGDELTAADVKKFKKISDDGKLRARALEWLLNRPHSTREFRDYLYRKKAESEQIEALVGEFGQRGYVDDAKFAQWFAELHDRRNKSNRQIKAELFKKGVSGEVADKVLHEQGDDEQARLKELIAKKQNLSRYKNDPQKLMQYLVAQGFNWSDIKQILNYNSSKD